MHPLNGIVAVGSMTIRCRSRRARPIALVVPWKYAFKLINRSSGINLVEDEPPAVGTSSFAE